MAGILPVCRHGGPQPYLGGGTQRPRRRRFRLYEFIDDAIVKPHEPGCAKANIMDLARLGQSLLNLIAKAVDDQVGLRMAVKVPHD